MIRILWDRILWDRFPTGQPRDLWHRFPTGQPRVLWDRFPTGQPRVLWDRFPTGQPRQFAARRRALTLVEGVIASVIVAVMLVAGLSTVAATRNGARQDEDRSRGLLLAQQLMAEILAQAYKDPDIPTLILGPEADELLTLDRSKYDDVDDYANLSDKPPHAKDGTLISGFSGWERTVSVQWADPTDLSRTRGTDSGLKIIVVTVRKNSADVLKLTALRGGT